MTSPREAGMLERLLHRIGLGPPPVSDEAYAGRLSCEQEIYRDQEQVHDLPPIFHYWSNEYLRPALEQYGFSSPDDFFRVYLARLCREQQAAQPNATLRFVSIGSGNCDLEAWLARSLVDEGLDNFRLECLDINEDMLARGRRHAEDKGVGAHLGFLRADFNQWRPKGTVDAVIANQCLHHVLELEYLFDGIRRRLSPRGYFLVSDMIGRNGHMRWPEALEAVQTFWRELPEDYRYNRLLKRHEPEYVNHDCLKGGGFEGVRAQDILPCLVERFHFELFVPFANVVDVFVDRAFGHNFDPDSERDRDFIDRVHAYDAAAIRDGRITPTHMIAALTTAPVQDPKWLDGIRPERCIRRPDPKEP